KGAVDKAKANYLSGQLRLRLQYAKLKVEHGWQRQTLSEVENLYFRHTHLTRPYPVISPGGRRNGRALSTNGVVTGTSQSNLASSGDGSGQDHPGAQANSVSAPGTSSRLGPNGSSGSTSLCSSTDVSASATVPSTPTIDGGRVITPHAPHVGSGNAATRYPVSRSDSTATV
ncbi:hypothetical protein BD413DRAFT_430349, partial [Trametes elegans]